MIGKGKKFTAEQEAEILKKCEELKALLKSYESTYDINTLVEDPLYDLYEWIGDIWYG